MTARSKENDWASAAIMGEGPDSTVNVFDDNGAALAAIMAEWTSSNDYATRIAHLRGDLAGGLNGSVFLRSKGPDATVFDDGAADTLQVGPRQRWIFATLDGPSADRLFASWPGQIMDALSAGK